MDWLKNNFIWLLITSVLGLFGYIINDKLTTINGRFDDLDEKIELMQTQKFDRYEEVLNDLDKKVLILQTRYEKL